ncbi:MAG: fibronectin type III domain-containing protein [Verrucomicrobiota bacterium]
MKVTRPSALRKHTARHRLLLCLAGAAFCLALPVFGSILLGPYVRFVGPEAATVNWLTPMANASIVEFGLTNSLGTRVENLTPTTNHSVTITGLKPRTKYYFVIKELINSLEVSSEVFDFESDYNYTIARRPACRRRTRTMP